MSRPDKSHVHPARAWHGDVHISCGPVDLAGVLTIPEEAGGLVLFWPGRGGGRQSERGQRLARSLQLAGFGSLLVDLLTFEEQGDPAASERWDDVGFLASRVWLATHWILQHELTSRYRIAYFGANTGAAAALTAASDPALEVAAIVSRSGRPDLAGEALERVRAPTLLIVGADDRPALAYNRTACDRLTGIRQLEVVDGASHHFPEPGTLDRVADHATRWFRQHLNP